MVINNGDHTFNGKPLFRAVIPVSGSVEPAEPIQAARSQKVFDQIVQTTGCSFEPDPLGCLRNVSYATFLNAVNDFHAVFGYSSLNQPYLPRPDTSSSFFSSSPEKPSLRVGTLTSPSYTGATKTKAPYLLSSLITSPSPPSSSPIYPHTF